MKPTPKDKKIESVLGLVLLALLFYIAGELSSPQIPPEIKSPHVGLMAMALAGGY